MRLLPFLAPSLYLIGIQPGYRVCASALHSPMITPAPFVERDDVGQAVGSQLIGYASKDGSYIPSSCPPDSTVKWEDNCGSCVATSAAEQVIWRSCEAESILVAANTRYQCGDGICYTALIFDDLDDKSPRSIYGCNAEPHQASLYIATTGTDITTTSDASTGMSSIRQTTTGSGRSTTTKNTASTASTSDASSTETDLNSSPSSSELGNHDLRWIAGPVVGGVVGIVMIGFLIWFIMRRRKNQEAANTRATSLDPVDLGRPNQVGALQFPTYQWQVESRESSPRKGQSYNGYMAWTTSSPTNCSSPVPEEKGKEG